MSIQTGMEACWQFDNNYLDAFGSFDLNNDGSVFSSSIKKIGTHSVKFDGIDDDCHVPGLSNLLNEPLTAGGWIYPISAGVFGRVFDQGGNGNIIYMGGASCVLDYSDVPDTCVAAITFNQWNHVIGVFDPVAGEEIIYIDGGEVNRITAGDRLASSAIFYIGNRFAGNRPFDGYIDDLARWNVTKTEDEILSLYNQGNKGISAIDAVIDLGDIASFKNIGRGLNRGIGRGL